MPGTARRRRLFATRIAVFTGAARHAGLSKFMLVGTLQDNARSGAGIRSAIAFNVKPEPSSHGWEGAEDPANRLASGRHPTGLTSRPCSIAVYALLSQGCAVGRATDDWFPCPRLHPAE